MGKKIIKVMVSWNGESYNGGLGDPEVGDIMVTAATLPDFRKEFEESLSFHIGGMVEHGDEVPESLASGDYEIEYELDTPALLRNAENYTTLTAISRATGINRKQLSHYATGVKRPRPESRARIIEGLHAIGRAVLAM